MIDLHAHTTCSDGTATPRELVALAAGIGLSAIAVTDHDSVDGVGEAADAGHDLGIEVVPGVEINLEHRQVTLDMLGYFFGAPPGDELRAALQDLRRYRDERNARILTRLTGLGFPLGPDDLEAVTSGDAVGRPHIGEAMRRRGYVDSISEAFARFLRRGAPAFVDRRRLALGEAVRLLRRSGGLAVIAHPGIIRADAAGLDRLVREAAHCGVEGLECFYQGHDDATVRRCLLLAERYELVPTGGSDFHGRTKPDVRLGIGSGGEPVPDEVLAALKARWRRRVRQAAGGAPEPVCDF